MIDDFQKQFDESMKSFKEIIDSLRIDPKFLAELLDIKRDRIVENNHEQSES